MKMHLSVVFTLCVVVVCTSAHVYDRGVYNQHVWKSLHFISSTTVRPGYEEIRVGSDGLLSMEAVVPKFKERGIFYREVTNGKTLLQLVYQNRELLVDCDMSREPDTVDGFIRKFFGLLPSEDWREMYADDITDRLEAVRNGTYHQYAAQEELPEPARDMLEFEMMKFDCKRLHREQRTHLKADNNMKKNLNNDPNNVIPLNDVDEDKQDSPLSHQPTDGEVKSRSKRGMFIYPGTNWCGKGSSASNYYDLGENIDTDKCCRAHDYCSVIIEGLSSNYNYFNYRLHTLSHCECDDQFHTCLKTSGDDVSEMVGNLFFNVIGNKCFVLKQSKVCLKRSWWGKCDKWKKQSQAELREALEY